MKRVEDDVRVWKKLCGASSSANSMALELVCRTRAFEPKVAELYVSYSNRGRSTDSLPSFSKVSTDNLSKDILFCPFR